MSDAVTTLHGCEYGPAQAPAILFLHGFLGDHREWLPMIETLANDYRCLAVDLPGHGKTVAGAEPDLYTMPGAARALTSFLDERGLEQVAVFGYSMGGRLGLYFAVKHPQRCRRLFIESASPGLLEPESAAQRRAHDERWAARFESESLADVLADWYAQPLFSSLKKNPDIYATMLERRLQNDPDALARSVRGMSVGAQEPLWPQLGTLAVPANVLVGERDRKYRTLARHIAATSPRWHVDVVPDAGHNAHLEQPTEVCEIIKKWMRK